MKQQFVPTLASILVSAAVGGMTAWLVLSHQQEQVAEEVAFTPAILKGTSLPSLPHLAEHDVAGSTSAASGLPTSFRMAANEALDAVVHVRTAQRVAPSGGWFGWSGYFQPDQQGGTIQQGSGSGVVLSDDGYIVTNHHVVDGADVIEVGFNDNRSMAATLVGSDPTTDIAVLKVEARSLSSMEWGDSDAVQVGDWVLAVGNPFDLTSTVTAGIVSAKARDIQLLRPDFDRSLFPVESFIQTDAAVNPGNSGGALVDVEGKLIGINTAIASRTGSYAGYAFAVPSNLANKIARDLIEFGSVQRAFMGVNIRPVDEALADRLDLPEVAGVLVAGVTENSGAERAGMQPGDVILSVEGTPTSTMPILLERVSRYRPGQQAEVEVWRDGATVRLDVELGGRDGLGTAAASRDAHSEGDERAVVFGCLIGPAPDGDEGVIVIELGPGPFLNAGVKEGMRLVAIDNAPVSNVDAFISALEKAGRSSQRGILLEGLDGQGEPVWFGVNLE